MIGYFFVVALIVLLLFLSFKNTQQRALELKIVFNVFCILFLWNRSADTNQESLALIIVIFNFLFYWVGTRLLYGKRS